MLWLLSGPPRFNLLCSSILFYVLLSTYLCFISFLYLVLYFLGDNAWIRVFLANLPSMCLEPYPNWEWGCHETRLSPPVKYFYWQFQGGTSFVDSLCCKGAKIRNQYNQVPHLTKDTNEKVTNGQLDTTNESQEVSSFPAGDHKAQINRRAQRHSKHKTEKRSKKEVPP